MKRQGAFQLLVVARLALLSCLAVSCGTAINHIHVPGCCPYQFSIDGNGKLISDLEWKARYSRTGDIDPKKYNYMPPPVMILYRSLLKRLERDLSANPILSEQVKDGYVDITSIDINFGYQYVEIVTVAEALSTGGGKIYYSISDNHSSLKRAKGLYDPSSFRLYAPIPGQYASTRMVMSFNYYPAGCDFSIPLKVDTGSQFHSENKAESLSNLQNMEQYELKFYQTLASSLAVLRGKLKSMLAHVTRYEKCSG